MTGQQLKNSILQLAVQGKLVPQDPADEPASQLLARIREEKEQLIREKKIKREKNPSQIFRGDDGHFYERVGKADPVCIDEELPFEIPETWEWARFGSTLINRDAERIPLSVNDRLKLDKIYDYYGASGAIDKVDQFLFDKPLLLIGEDGANLLLRSKPIAFIAKGKYWVNNHAHVLDAIDYTILEYVAIFINAINLAPYVTGTAQPKMNQKKMNSILLAIPPLAEQQRIVEKIDELMPFVDHYDELEKQLETLNTTFPDQLKKSILQYAIQGKLVPQDPTDEPANTLLERIRAEKAQLIKDGKIKREKNPSQIFRGEDGHFYERVGNNEPVCIDDQLPFEIPESWEWARLGSIISVSSGKNLTKKHMNSLGRIPVYGGNGLTGYHDKYNVTKPTLVIGRVGYYCGSTHITEKLAWVTDNAFITTFNEKCIQIQWLKLLLDYLNPKKYASSTAQPVISGKLLYPLLIPLPPLAEQQRIVAKLEQLDVFIDQIKIAK